MNGGAYNEMKSDQNALTKMHSVSMWSWYNIYPKISKHSRGYKKSFMLTQLSMIFFLLINVKMPTIVGILTFMSKKNSILGLSEPEKSWITWYFYIYENSKFHTQLSWGWEKFYNLGSRPQRLGQCCPSISYALGKGWSKFLLLDHVPQTLCTLRPQALWFC